MLSSANFHKDFLPLRLNTHEIGVGGLKFARKMSKEALSALLFEPHNEMFSWQADSFVDITFTLTHENDQSFNVTIEADFTLVSTCVRCLESVEHRFFLDFSILMFEKDQFLTEENQNLEWEFDSNEIDTSKDEELSVGYFTNHCIDLGIILRDQIFFEAPDYPHCIGKDGSLTCKVSVETMDNDIKAASNSPFLKLLNKTR